ncbi:MAG TPA: tRNA (N6-isopentenyl adenosine(37)-C2)-methylthiotransferase MiaB [Dehalococcoidales bacterium]|jgi:tRNA-2-methylthio-N6-dimethylallyladenosine synthase
MLTYYIWTIGCQMNKAESERLAAYLDQLGYQPSESAEGASLILLNSCVVRQSAENRVVNKLHSLKTFKKTHPDTTIALTGCIIGSDSEKLKSVFPFIDHFFPAGEFPTWLGEFDAVKTLPRNPGVATFIPIMQGCNNFCSYCVVPFRRGHERSRTPDELVGEVTALIRRGVKEVTLLGQNVDSYGSDLGGQSDLADLLSQLNSLEGLERIRFLTNHPKDMKSKLIDTVARLDKVCEQINLPVQAGDDEILKAMRRGYTVDQFRRLIEQIRAKVPGIALSTDVIVGFPGETDTQFNHTHSLLADIRFDMVHVAAYSPRPDTLAARTLSDDVPSAAKKQRLAMVEVLQSKIAGEINSLLLNQTVEILIEGRQKGRWYGRTRGDKLVFISDQGDFQSKLVKVKISRTSPWSLTGHLSSA